MCIRDSSYPVHLHNADVSYRLDALNNKQYDPGYYKDDEGVTISTRNQYVDLSLIHIYSRDEKD